MENLKIYQVTMYPKTDKEKADFKTALVELYENIGELCHIAHDLGINDLGIFKDNRDCRNLLNDIEKCYNTFLRERSIHNHIHLYFLPIIYPLEFKNPKEIKNTISSALSVYKTIEKIVCDELLDRLNTVEYRNLVIDMLLNKYHIAKICHLKYLTSKDNQVSTADKLMNRYMNKSNELADIANSITQQCNTLAGLLIVNERLDALILEILNLIGVNNIESSLYDKIIDHIKCTDLTIKSMYKTLRSKNLEHKMLNIDMYLEDIDKRRKLVEEEIEEIKKKRKLAKDDLEKIKKSIDAVKEKSESSEDSELYDINWSENSEPTNKITG